MPNRIPHPCASPGCPNLTNQRYCFSCEGKARERQLQAQRAQESKRLSPFRRGYDAEWRKLRLKFLRSNPYCWDPFRLHGTITLATTVDHILAKAKGGTDAWENLQALCHSCHSRKTAIEDGRWG
jgi:5-methylcytosine-specific restriction protein A